MSAVDKDTPYSSTEINDADDAAASKMIALNNYARHYHDMMRGHKTLMALLARSVALSERYMAEQDKRKRHEINHELGTNQHETVLALRSIAKAYDGWCSYPALTSPSSHENNVKTRDEMYTALAHVEEPKPRQLYLRLQMPACSEVDWDWRASAQQRRVSPNSEYVHPARVGTWEFDLGPYAQELMRLTRVWVNVHQDHPFSLRMGQAACAVRVEESLQNIIEAMQKADLACGHGMLLEPNAKNYGYPRSDLAALCANIGIFAHRIDARSEYGPRMLLPIRCTAPHAYPLQLDADGAPDLVLHGALDMARFHAEYESGARPECAALRHSSALAHEFTLMSMMRCKYGMLTTGLHTWLLRRIMGDDGVETLEVSQDFLINATGADGRPTWAQACAAFIMHAKADSEWEMPASQHFEQRMADVRVHELHAPFETLSDDGDSDGGEAGQVGEGGGAAEPDYAALPLNLERFDFRPLRAAGFESDNLEKRYRLQLGGYDSVLVVADADQWREASNRDEHSFRATAGTALHARPRESDSDLDEADSESGSDHGAAAALDDEDPWENVPEPRIYWALRSVWGVAVPPLVLDHCGLGCGREGFAFLYSGPSLYKARALLQGNAGEEIQRSAEAALSAMHAAGVVHGSVSASSIVVQNNRALFVKLERATIDAWGMEEDKARDVAALAEIFATNRKT